MAQKDSNKKSKNKVVTSAIAAALALVMLIGGGSYAYLQDTSDDVTNNFNTNKDLVDITETTGQDYNIIPGTSEDKDPVISVDNTVDSYLYAIVTDTTDGLVTYDIADGWTLLEGAGSENTKVYYREVAKDADTKEFSVLKDNKVSYASTIENKDMLKEDGKTLKDGLALTFEGYTIQKEGFATALDGYNQAFTTASTADEVTTAIANGKEVILSGDVSLPENVLKNGGDVNLSGKTVTINKVSSGGNVDGDITKDATISNGTLKLNSADAYQVNTGVFNVRSGGSLTLDNVTADFGSATGAFVYQGSQPADITVKNSTITTKGAYCVGTNALTGDNAPTITIDNSTLTAESADGDDNAVLFNVPGTLTIKDSTITADRQAVIIRDGTATITNSTLTATGTGVGSTKAAKYDDSDWRGGNEVPGAALVVGDRHSEYRYDATVTLSGVTLNYGVSGRKPVYAAAQKDAGGNHTTTIKGISADKVTVYQGDGGTVTVTE